MHSYDLQVLEAVLLEETVLCTLISVEGGFSRGVGAQIAITKDGRCIGDMTGGCLESALVNDAASATERAQVTLISSSLVAAASNFMSMPSLMWRLLVRRFYP
jgi:xanthine/CO dehydrogenase XdhC/CoxF family maturation factor